jgi:hypothetical protein
MAQRQGNEAHPDEKVEAGEMLEAGNRNEGEMAKYEG